MDIANGTKISEGAAMTEDQSLREQALRHAINALRPDAAVGQILAGAQAFYQFLTNLPDPQPQPSTADFREVDEETHHD
jgi:hypothetical protein